MGKPHPIEMRERVVAFAEDGRGHREAALHLSVSPRFVNNMVILKRASGALVPARQGHISGGSWRSIVHGVRGRLAQNGDLTLDELCIELSSRRIMVHRSTVGPAAPAWPEP